jgi:hypothetical protein
VQARISTWARLVLAACTLCVAGASRSADKTPAEWQALARADLDATRAAIVAAHPGYIDDQNPTFRAWTEQGYREALALVPRVASYDGMLAAVRYYVTSFRDGHFIYSDDRRDNGYRVLTNGWMLDRVGDAYVVVGHNPEWQGPLPPLDAKLLGCDGRTPQALVDEDAAPYVERRGLPDLQGVLAGVLAYPPLIGMGYQTCDFEQADGKRLHFPVTYQTVSAGSIFKTRARPQRRMERRNAYTFENGVLWIRAQNFMLSPAQVKELDVMLKEIAALQGVRTIVFDARGNGGGDSSVGNQILMAATGGIEFDRAGLDRLPQTYPQWRVSDVALEAADRYVDMMTQRYGADSDRVRDMARLREQFRAAKEAGRAWVDQPGGPRVTRAEIARRHPRLKRFDGTVAVIADATCASACLDFVDQVRLLPNSIQLGQTTSSDTVYLESAGRVTLPSGNHLAMPLKVWRNRVRGDSEALVPDVPLHVDMRDDAAVRTATLAALEKTGAPR